MGAAGRLILVTSADSGRLDLVLRAACRRMGPGARLTLVEAIGTRCQPAGGGIIVSRSAFATLERAGALALVWQRDGARFGHSVNLLARLAMGENIVAAAPLEIERAARKIWPNLRILRLDTGTERLRGSLAPLDPPRMGAISGFAKAEHDFDKRLADNGELGTAVRMLAAAIDESLPPREARAAKVNAPRHSTVTTAAGRRGGMKPADAKPTPLARLAHTPRPEHFPLDSARRKAV